MNINSAHHQWATRPDDERFQTLDDLKEAVAGRQRRARLVELSPKVLQFTAPTSGSVAVHLRDEVTTPSHWAFGQLASQLGAPAAYLRKLPPKLAVENLYHGIERYDGSEAKYLLDTDDDGAYTTLRAATSLTYGRIWDFEVVEMVQKIVAYTEGRFFNPKEWGGTPGGLYASDRDVFLFMIDGGSIVDGGGERDQMHRGFYAWNSEVGSATFGLMTFLFRMVCGNHLIWGAEDVKKVTIRHNGLAPSRFLQEVQPALMSYVNASAQPLEEKIKKAKQHLLSDKRNERIEWLTAQGFTRGEALGALTAAEREEGDSRTLWQVVNGLTAHAREYAHLDARVALEKRAGNLLSQS